MRRVSRFLPELQSSRKENLENTKKNDTVQPMQIASSQLRQKYLDFFRSKNHAIIPSAPLVPENDASVLFNTAGMQPLVPYLLGEKHPM